MKVRKPTIVGDNIKGHIGLGPVRVPTPRAGGEQVLMKRIKWTMYDMKFISSSRGVATED